MSTNYDLKPWYPQGGPYYYVDQVNGNDSWDGRNAHFTSGSTGPWKTIAKVNASSFSPGNNVLLKKGCTWRETLTVPSSGSAGNPITFGAYGSGAVPIITGAVLTSDWSVVSDTTINFDFTSGSLPGEITFTRASSGTYFNNSAVLSTATTDAARFNYISGTPYLLIEPAATNLILQSNAFTTTWGPQNGGVATAAQFTSPDDTNDGWDITSGSGWGGVVQWPNISAVQYTVSVWAYRRTGTPPLRFYVNDIDSGDLTTSATITRYSYTGTPAAATPGAMQISVSAASGSSLGVFGYQWETGAKATSYIPTTTGTATRAADVASFTIPAGVTQLTYTFDDNSTQVVSVSPGTYQIPTNLNRPNIKSIVSDGSLSVWKATVTTQPYMTFFDDVIGTKVASIATCDSARKWYWNANLLYTYGTADPLGTYTKIEPVTGPTAGTGLVDFNGKSYVTFDGIELRYSNGYGFKSYSASDNQTDKKVKNCIVSYTQDGGICFVADTHYFLNTVISGNIVHHTNMEVPWGNGEAEGITIQYGDGFEISGNTVYSHYEEAIDPHTGAKNGTIHHNVVHGFLGDGTRPAIYIDGGTNIDVYSNEVYDEHYGPSPFAAAISVNIENDSFPNDNLRFFYNLIHDSDMGITFNNVGTSNTSNVKIYNNVIANNGYGLYWASGMLNNWTGTNEVKNNIFWQNTANEIQDDTTGNASIAGTTIAYNFFKTGASSETTGSSPVVAASPLFVSASDFHLQAGSPAINAGVDVGLSTDFDGVAVGNPPEIGAYEKVG